MPRVLEAMLHAQKRRGAHPQKGERHGKPEHDLRERTVNGSQANEASSTSNGAKERKWRLVQSQEALVSHLGATRHAYGRPWSSQGSSELHATR